MLAEYLNSFLSHMNVLARRVASKNNLSLSQYYTLNSISSNGISMSYLSSTIGIDNSTLTRNINILMQRSLVKKDRSKDDRREFIVILSSKGEKVVNKLDNQMESLINTLISDINPESRQEFIDTIEQLNWKISGYIHEL